MWPTLRTMAEKRYPEDEEQAALTALGLWTVFIQQQGQEHWRCACAEEDSHGEVREAGE